MFETSRLLRPLNFLRIRSRGIRSFCWRIPLIWLFGLGIYFFFFPVSILEKKILLDSMLNSCGSMLGILPGFYIAALAAIATFSKRGMDSPLEGESATIRTREDGETRERILTRRRFLCLLFGYLSFLSLALSLSAIILKNLNPIRIIEVYFPDKTMWILIGYFFLDILFIFAFLQMLILTFLGLFYLCDRIHWVKPSFK